MLIRLVVFDADDTLWDRSDISALNPPFTRLREDLLVDRSGVRIQLFQGVKEALKELNAKGIVVSMASWNRPQPVFEALRRFGIEEYFTHPKVEFHPNKHEMIRSLLADLATEGIIMKPEEILYVDDSMRHIDIVREKIGPVRFLQFGVDITGIPDVLKHIGNGRNDSYLDE